jgi:enoyl-CoA hydratase/carnithine racemase
VPVHWECDGSVGVALLDRPERRNALDAEMCAALTEHLEAHPDLRALVIGGAGEQAFCAGADLGRRAADHGGGGLEHGGGDSFRPAFDALLGAIVDYPSPVIAAVNGAAVGAGMQLAVACDLRVVAAHATFGIPAARIGVLITSPNVTRLIDVVGQAMARDLLLTARTLDVDEAERVGLVQRRAPDALAAARDLAYEIAALAPLSVAGHKRALDLVAEARRLGSAASSELSDLETRAFASDDLREGLAAFAEKRPPRFEGR